MFDPSGFRDDVSGICVDDRALLCSRDRNGRIYAAAYSVDADPVPKIQQVTESCNDPYTTFLRIWSALPAGCGVVIYYYIRFVHAQSAALSDPAAEITEKLKLISDGLVHNWAMWITVIAFVVVILFVNLLRTRAFDYAWRIAVIAGGVIYILVILAGDFCLSITVAMVPMILSTVISGGDYSRTERLEYEDHEYYYYVKAVPKASVATSERSIKKINAEPVKEEKKEDNVVSFSDDVFPEKNEMHTVKMPDMVSENTVSEKPQGLDKIDFEKQLEESLKDL